MKKITKDEWIKLLQRELIPHFHDHDVSYEDKYITPENLIITVTTKTKIRRSYTFGGPVYSATLDFSDSNKLHVNFSSPRKKPYKIKWQNVKEITLRFLSA
jgi:hypothetical protein